MSHSRLLWFDVVTRSVAVLREERDVRFRGAFRGDGGHSLVVLTTPNLRRESIFVELALPSGSLTRQVTAKGTYDGHEVVRYGDRAYVVSTGTGAIHVYCARTLALRHIHALWSRREHVNTVALTPSLMFVMLHHKRRQPSEVHVVERARHATAGRLKARGTSAHGLARWGDELLSLDSDGGRLLASPVAALPSARAGATTAVGLADAPPRVVWQSGGAPCFLKGLSVHAGVAYFGLSPPQGRQLDRMRVNSTLLAVDLRSGRELYRMGMATHGLLNLIAAPAYLAPPPPPSPIPLAAKAISAFAHEARTPAAHRVVSLGPVDISALRRAVLSQWVDLWSGAHAFGHLFPGLASYAKLFVNVQNAKLIFSCAPAILRNSRAARAALAASPNALEALPWPQTERWRVLFPAWRLLRPALLPILDELFGRRLGLGPLYHRRILRVQINRMPAGAAIHRHRDQGFYAGHAHRYHVPLLIPRCVRFAHLRAAKLAAAADAPGAARADGGGAARAAAAAAEEEEWEEIPFKEGEAIEVNNRITHRVQQTGPFERVTLIIDMLEGPVDTTVEITGACTSWFEASCYSSANVSDAAFLGEGG